MMHGCDCDLEEDRAYGRPSQSIEANITDEGASPFMIIRRVINVAETDETESTEQP
jgi:hypothetical protein